ncbi:type IV pilin protein [Gilvimarinus algae]|uniref:Type IV pilin protein n=1 Tax=Gilvimarinus algae TaxID=3058037 RepID=A0ABT8TBP7_9GAMM|nr:type IV pilin protein [Gilvimarinus sp. SDUM040014]MDO3380798.1 type IV pilin protein [Gilvimarinus sp. SDUM040014]
MKQHQGFSLVELVIVVAIISLLAVIALPAYVDHVRRGNRTDAMASLTSAAHEMQRCYTLNNSYADCPALGSRDSDEEFYSIEIELSDGGAGYLATATAVKSPQTGDTDCASFTLNHLGQKGATPDTEGRCW